VNRCIKHRDCRQAKEEDEDDNHVLELAVGGNANAVATHNKRDFMEGELLFPHIQILTPKELLVASKEE
jgi:predicted nucleic acid-binding protein